MITNQQSKEIFIYGAGTYGEVMFELAEVCGFNPVGFYDDDLEKKGNMVMGIPVLGKLEINKESVSGKNIVVAIGDNGLRRKFMLAIRQASGQLPALIHPQAKISKYASIGEGCYLHAQTNIWTKAVVSDFSIISPNAIIAHHTKLGEAGFVSAGANVGAGVELGDGVLIGIGATIMTGVKRIGKQAVVGAGAVVIRDVEPSAVVAGNPAKQLKKIKKKAE